MVQDWEDSSTGKVLTPRAQGPEFKSLEPIKNQGVHGGPAAIPGSRVRKSQDQGRLAPRPLVNPTLI